MNNATVVLLRGVPGGVDEYGDPIASTDERTPLDEAAVAPRSSGDLDERGRQGVVVGLSLYVPYDAGVLATDRFEVDGVVYEIEGEPGKWKNPLTDVEAGTEVALRRAAG